MSLTQSAGTRVPRPSAAPAASRPRNLGLALVVIAAAIYSHALAAGISRGFLVASGVALAALIITVVTIRVRRTDLAGAGSGPPRG